MNSQSAKIEALGLALSYLRNQNVTADLHEAGFVDDEIEVIQGTYCEIVDDLQTQLNLWRDDRLQHNCTDVAEIK